MMDNPKKETKYMAYNVDNVPEAAIYSGPTTTDAISGIPLYPQDTPGNPPLNRFVVQGYKDLWAALLFIAAVLMTLIWGSINTAAHRSSSEHNNGNNVPGGDNSMPDMSVLQSLATLGVMFCISCLGAVGSLTLLKYFPKELIYIANALTAALMLVASVFFMVSGALLLSILLLFMCGMQALWLFLVRDRIPFSAELLKVSSTVLTQYKAIFVFNFLLGFMAVVFIHCWMAMALYSSTTREDSTGGKFFFALFALILFWVFQVVPNLMHVTTAGVTATWYFAGAGRMPKNPTLKSFKRATTTSFGSVCFGSLIVAVIRLLRWLAESARENENEFIRCVTVCALECLESLVEYFNTYAFVHVAVYGCGYIEAAKRTWELCKQCFFAAYFNDALVGATLNLMSFGASLFVAALAGVIYGDSTFALLGFLVSLLVHSLFFSAVESAVTTIFVCFAEVPEGLQESSPDLYAALHAADNNGTHNNAGYP